MKWNAHNLDELFRLRRELHASPEVSGDESGTAARIRRWLKAARPDEILDGLGGHGLAAVYCGQSGDGPTVLLRADLDALPIQERSSAEWCSRVAGVSHACGHDGHMAMLASLAPTLAARRPARGRVVLLFQPAEETGEGAMRVIEDPAFDRIRPDLAFALHNLPGRPLGSVLVKPGTFAMGSVGMSVGLRGRTAHAAYPEQGLSPAPAMVELIRRFELLASQQPPDHGFCLATLTHARLGEQTFGTAPGEAVLQLTLRSDTEAGIETLRNTATQQAEQVAASHGLSAELTEHEPFPVTINDATCTDHVIEAARSLELNVDELNEPMRWSEDFGWFLKHTPGALFGLGSGTSQPPLHAPDYDFPDDLIEIGARLWHRLLERILLV